MSLVGAVSVKNGAKGAMEPAKVTRHFPNRNVEDTIEEEELSVVFGGKATTISTPTENKIHTIKSITPQPTIKSRSTIEDSSSSDSDDEEDPRIRRRRLQMQRKIETPQIIKKNEQKPVQEQIPISKPIIRQDLSSDSEDEEIVNRRERARVKYQQKQEELKKKLEEEMREKLQLEQSRQRDLQNMEIEEEEEEEEEESEEMEEEESEEEILKPVFIPKDRRETILEEQKRLEEEQKRELERIERLKQRVDETKILVQREIEKEVIQKEKGVDSDDEVDLPDDTDYPQDAEKEYLAWREREKRRCKAERDERTRWEREKAEIERRRNLTDRERMKEDEEFRRKHGIQEKKKTKWKFLQKYYHTGAFFKELDETGKYTEEIYNRDYGLPTLEDHFNKETLPKILQVKNFGKKGRTKYTHLKDQDTTSFDGPRYEPRFKGDVLDRPAKRRKK